MSHEVMKNRALFIAVVFLAALAMLFLLFNAKYIWEQVKYAFNKPEVVVVENEVKIASDNQQDTQVTQPNLVSIPSLGITAPVVESAGNTEADFQQALQHGVVRYPGTAKPGQIGNVYLFGHSSDFPFKKGDYKTVFALLPNIADKAEIKLSDEQGSLHVYQVVNRFVANTTDVHLLSQETNGKKILTLQTSYPVGTALQRYIVQAELAQ